MIHPSDDKTLISGEEGRRNVAYRDSRGIWTNGEGHKYGDDADHTGDTWSDAKVDAVFAADSANARNSLAAHWPPFGSLDPVRQAYVVSMVFQLGLHGALGFQHALAALARGDWVAAKICTLASDWHAQTPGRCERCAEAFLTGQWQAIP